MHDPFVISPSSVSEPAHELSGLSRKWRPDKPLLTSSAEHVLTALANGLSLGRIHHAYLFRYPRGRKTSIARLLAKGLNCETGITATPAACAITAGKLNRGALSI